MDAEQSTQQDQRVFNPTVRRKIRENKSVTKKAETQTLITPTCSQLSGTPWHATQQAKRGRPRDCRSE